MGICIVTGASSGIGKEFVKKLDEKYTFDEIWVVARRKDRLIELQKEVNTKLNILELDLSTDSAINAFKKLVDATSPDITMLVNNAGVGLFGAFEDLDLDEQLQSIDVNVKALTAITYICLKHMRAGSTIINIGSNSSWQPVPYENTYAATKAYVLSFSRGLGKELKKRDIHVMCVCPGWIRTEFIDHAMVDDTIKFFDRWYEPDQVAIQALKDLDKKKKISILGLPVRLQVALVKHLPVEFVMNTWVKQQKMN